MALPHVFANVSVLQTPHLDDNFNALGALVIIPCTASGTNTILLTPASNTPTVSAYSNLTPVFAFIAAATSNGAVTINVNGIGAKNLYKSNGAVAAGAGDIVSGGLYVISYNSALNAAVGGFVMNNPSTVRAPNVSRITSGTGATFTPVAGDVLWRVTMCGSGSGGCASNLATAPTAGGTTSFKVNSDAATWTCGGGTAGGGVNPGAGGSGGTTGTTGTLVNRVSGGSGHGGMNTSVANVASPGGAGGANPFGGAGRGSPTGTVGGTAAANSGGGGGGGGAPGTQNSGAGGGAGEWVQFWVTGMTTGTYTVAAGGAGTPGGTQAGGAGADGLIIVEGFPGI